MENYIYVFEHRHEEMRDIWNLPDEVAEAAIKFVEECCYDEVFSEHNALVDYDNLAINAEIKEKDEATEEDYDNALFATDNYLVMSW